MELHTVAKGFQTVAEIGEGLRAVARGPILRAFLASMATLDLFWNGIMAVYVLFLTRELGLPPAAFGLIVALGSVGALAGSAVAHRATRRVGLGRTLIGAQLLLGAGGLPLALAVLCLGPVDPDQQHDLARRRGTRAPRAAAVLVVQRSWRGVLAGRRPPRNTAWAASCSSSSWRRGAWPAPCRHRTGTLRRTAGTAGAGPHPTSGASAEPNAAAHAPLP